MRKAILILVASFAVLAGAGNAAARVASGRSAEHYGPESLPAVGCLHLTTGRVGGRVHPSRCDFAGYRNRNTEFFEVSFRDISWHHWGAKNTGSSGYEIATGRYIRIIVYGQVECADGRRWYSWANFVNVRTGEFLDVHLAVCGRRSAGWPRRLY